MKVLDRFRTNKLSHIPGGVTVCVKYFSGKIFEYDKVKNHELFIEKVYENSEVEKAWVKPNSLTKK